MLRNFYIIILSSLSFFSCQIEKKEKSSVFVGGEIINPKDEYVKIYQGGTLLDSTLLDDKNRFSLSLAKVNNGLYYFSHGREYQYLYLEPGDSVLIRLNTFDFDESLAFCGNGSEENNLLIKLFLLNEKNQKKYYRDYGLETTVFDAKQQELIAEKTALVNKYRTTNESLFQPDFEALLNVEINYPEYYRKEIYPIRYMVEHQLDSFPKLPKTFFDFEKKIDFNNENVITNRNYYVLLDAYFTRQTYLEYFKKRDKNIPNSEKKDFVLHKLDRIKEKISNKKVQDNLIEYNIIRFAQINPMDVNVLEAFQVYLKDLKDDDFKIELKRIINNYASLAQGQNAPKIYIHNTKDDITTIQKLAKDKMAVFYYWTVEDTKYISGMKNRVSALKKAFPKVNFYAINIDSPASNWKALAQEKGLDLNHIYQLENSADLSQKLSLKTLSNVIITTPDGKIITAFENLFSPQLPYILNLTNIKH